MKLIIAGGRDYIGNRDDHKFLDALHKINIVTEVVSGCAKGADKMGEVWANLRGIPIKKFPADWNTFGKSAGHKRNKEMALYADAVVLFPGGRGTDSMYKEAKKVGLSIYDNRKASKLNFLL